MKLVDHEAVQNQGWSIIIDEDPKIWSHASFDVCASKPFWSATYNLEPFMEGYSTITPKADAPTWREVMADDLTRPFAAFHARLNRGPVIVNLSSWDDLSQRKQLAYFSVWDVRELAVYDRVTFLANSFDKLITFRLIQALYPEIAMQAIQIGRQQMKKLSSSDLFAVYLLAPVALFILSLIGSLAYICYAAGPWHLAGFLICAAYYVGCVAHVALRAHEEDRAEGGDQ